MSDSAPGRTALPARRRWLHRYAVLVGVCTLLLIIAGGLVTSTGSGLAVPDWPLSYGMLMPPMVGGILYEHGHRMVATAVGFLTIILAVWTWRVEPRRWVRRLGWGALAAVIAQGLLGGMTVLFLLPTPVSVAHACLAQTFFCAVVMLAVVTSPAWLRHADRDGARLRADEGRPSTLALALAATAAVYLQLVLGALMRHTGSGLAIPDFPLAFGRLLPPTWNAQIAIHFAHRAWAVVVAILVIAAAVRVMRRHHQVAILNRIAGIMLVMLPLQIALGAITVVSAKAVAVTTLHVAIGAALLGTSLTLALFSGRALQRHAEAPVTAAPHPQLSTATGRVTS